MERASQLPATLQQQMGKLLNIHAEMAHSPVVLAAYTGMREAIATHGSFDTPTREAIALAVGAVDHCDYCQSAHTLGGKAAGLDADQMIAVRAGRPTGDDKLDALLAIVREAAGQVGDGTWKQAREAGWTDADRIEALVALRSRVAMLDQVEELIATIRADVQDARTDREPAVDARVSHGHG